MNPAAVPRHTFLPPPGRPRWQPGAATDLELLYLSWGVRWMGDHPIPMAQHEGWAYLAVMEGTPTILTRDGSLRVRRGNIFIVHPDCAYGWSDRPGASCRLMSWLWRTPPAHSLLAPPPSAYRRQEVDDAALRRLTAINRLCQRHVALAGETAGLALRRSHLDLDIALAEALCRREKGNPEYRMKMALNYLHQNPAALQPGKSLCEYLQISPATLRSLFQKHCGKSPQAVALELRMERARKRLAVRTVTVKEVASELGYGHPNDFSRAYKRYFGESISHERK